VVWGCVFGGGGGGCFVVNVSRRELG
jgi:hypothetical protein